MAVEPFWYHFWTFNIFELFEGFTAEIIVFFIIFFEKITKFLRGGDGFSITNFSSLFLRGKSLVIFLIWKFLITLVVIYYICYGYTVSLRTISNSIVTKTSRFFVLGEKIPRFRDYTGGHSQKIQVIFNIYSV